MTDIDIRGGLGDDAPLALTGEFTGYNNGATMQVGLWIANDSEHYHFARTVIATRGAAGLAEYLTGVMRRAARSSAPGLAHGAAAESEGGLASVDWAQIACDLLGDEPSDAELVAAHAELRLPASRRGDSAAYELAQRHRAASVRRIVLGVPA